MVLSSLRQQASNIDDVLCHHTSFLDNCLKDCMLTNPELLRIFSKLMAVCVMFTNCMQVCVCCSFTQRSLPRSPNGTNVMFLTVAALRSEHEVRAALSGAGGDGWSCQSK